ncbi:cobalt-precorrin-6A reductase [Roseobacter sp. HKCCD9010]|uniref:cobalt-precorrin-6A reductase n=1 Tax=unclassified Roseobacter TaxID=196798 RepID=UPI0014928A78|nr:MULTISPECIES: cobalt-precorrin-6A reductase [unclassified Roseobacter]MBF9051947.1 cobalt-precorrin-6A reductase [Rhodobacterales bacterium HKCCD4356]NNV13940.1 cobalt-precorrin-6A reductase [Roseobacter sp. HKCCD7357]NNV18112.1 cobalt-precorrin-6A reductase [Roseobacter sp. HKCCD8768]NNV27572.1 cobalt-precorrin-6A reductase [Roseobacter sp. HKCCD8192]NNV31838.1 cobalt-precorrin-6A reductase [Roseobacter sp. HKCCD9061]
MALNPLILGGTTEATALARAVAERNQNATVSFAGRVERPLRQPLPQRVGGFGGVAGLVQYLQAHQITHVIDATHPFAVQMSRNAVVACAEASVPLTALTRPAWTPVTGDNWEHVPDIAGAVAALNRPSKRVMLAVGRMHLADFAPNPQHSYLLRLIDPPAEPLPFPDAEVILDRGPFDAASDQRLMQSRGIELVVSKNSGGTGAYAKIAAARSLGVSVLMIDRPLPPPRHEVHDVPAVFDWLAHSGTALGV